jgi:hypothetical protein
MISAAPRRRLLVAVVAFAAAGIAACGDDVFDQEELEEKISTGLEQDAGVAPEAVDCPSDAPREKGSKFECTGTAPAGDEFTIEVDVTGDDGRFEAVVPPEQFK